MRANDYYSPWRRCRADGRGLTGSFDFRAWTGRQEVGPLTVTVARMAHTVPTYAMRVEHGGRVLQVLGRPASTFMTTRSGARTSLKLVALSLVRM